MSPIEPGTYPAKCTNVEFGLSKKGNPMITPTIEVIVNGKARTRKAFLVTSGEGAMGFDQLLRACGFEDLADKYRDPSVQPKPDFDTDQLIGQEFEVVIDQQLYEGQKRDFIQTYLKG